MNPPDPIATTPTLPFADLPPPPPLPPVAWTGGRPSGQRLSLEERNHIKALFISGCSRAEIEQKTKHGRKTIAAVIASDPELVGQLKEGRQNRLIVEEHFLHEDREETLKAKKDAGKLSVADLNSAIMINGILIKDSGGAAPRRIILEADQNLALAAQMFAGIKPTPPDQDIIDITEIPSQNDQGLGRRSSDSDPT